jgi:hypothetical protein
MNKFVESPEIFDLPDKPIELLPAPAPYVPPPLDLLPSELQDYVHAAAASLNVDVSFILLPLLSAIGSAIGNTRSIILKRNFIQPPVIWTGIIGRSGSRKSPALDAATFAVARQNSPTYCAATNGISWSCYNWAGSWRIPKRLRKPSSFAMMTTPATASSKPGPPLTAFIPAMSCSPY